MTFEELKSEYLSVVNAYMYDILGKCQNLVSLLTISGSAVVDRDILNKDIINLEKLNILSRGLTMCNNYEEYITKNPFLLTGINPSYKEGDGVHPWDMAFYTFLTADNGYFKKKRKQFGDLYKGMAYFDLFPLKERDQRTFERVFEADNLFRGQVVGVTQRHIEDLAPKLIVHANRDSMYYWGINNKNAIEKGATVNNLSAPWLGYKVKTISLEELPPCIKKFNRNERFPLYQITGLIDSENRINHNIIKKSRLEGSYIMEYVMEYRSKDDVQSLYDKYDWEEIWNWVMKH